MRRRLFIAVLVGALAGAVPAGARAIPRTTKFFVHIATAQSGVGGEFDYYLDTGDYPDEANGAGTFSSGLPNEVSRATGVGESWRDVFPAREALPLRLDGRRPITGQVALKTFESNVLVRVPAGAGQAVVEIELVGTPEGSEDRVLIGTQTHEFIVTPAEPQHVVEVRIEPDAALHGTTFTELSLITHVRGASLATGFFELDDPPSYVEIPTLRPART